MLPEKLEEKARKIEDDLIALRRSIHRNPELSLEEHETTALVESEIEKRGISCSRMGLGTGLVAHIQGKAPGKTLALRGDMDALPITENTGLAFASKKSGTMHACGHDIHTTVLLGAASLLANLRDEFAGTVKFLFQPAEEKLVGARSMMEAGALENPNADAIVGLHCWPEIPAGTIGLRNGPLMAAADSFEIVIAGKGGHAAHPHKCVDPIVIAAQTIIQLQTIVSRGASPVDPIVVTVGSIHGGTASNVIPPEVRLSGTVRTVNIRTRSHAQDSVERIARLTAEALNGQAVVTFHHGTPPLVGDDTIVDLMRVGITEALGEERVVELAEPSMGGEDFAFYLEKVPGALMRLGTRNDDEQSQLPLHSPRIVFDERAIVTGVVAMTATALKFLNA